MVAMNTAIGAVFVYANQAGYQIPIVVALLLVAVQTAAGIFASSMPSWSEAPAAARAITRDAQQRGLR
jgi:hypothetical protein